MPGNDFVTSTNPAHSAVAITPHDTDPQGGPWRSLLLGTGGTLYVDVVGTGTNVKVVYAAGILPLHVSRVYATGLVDVADILGLN